MKINANADKFLKDVEQLTTKLTSLYVKNNIPLEVATKMATKIGVESLVSKATDSDTRIVLKAAEFSSIQAAVQKFNESTSTPAVQIFNTQFRKVNSNRGYSGRGNTNHRFGYRNSNNRQFQNESQYQPRYSNQRQNSRGNYHQGRGNYSNQNRGHYRYQNNNQGNARIFYTPAQLPQVPLQNMQQQELNPPAMTHVLMPPNMPHGINLPHVQPHPLGGTQGQYSQ